VKIAVIGGGPGGLYLALLTKKARPDWRIDVYEQNRADDTFGFGVVFSEETLEEFLSRDAPSFAMIKDAFAYWDDIVIRYHGSETRCGGNGFAGCSRLELLQILLFLRGEGIGELMEIPQLCLLLSCWDELGQSEPPLAVLRRQLPMFGDFVSANWKDPIVLGLSALERPLDRRVRDEDYVARGPEHFGYVVQAHGQTSSDLTLPLDMLLKGDRAR